MKIKVYLCQYFSEGPYFWSFEGSGEQSEYEIEKKTYRFI